MKNFDFSVFDGYTLRISACHIEKGVRCDAKNTPLGILIKEHLDYEFRDDLVNLGVRYVEDMSVIWIEDRQTGGLYDVWRLSKGLQGWCEDFNYARSVSPVWLNVSIATDGVLEIGMSESTIQPIEDITGKVVFV